MVLIAVTATIILSGVFAIITITTNNRFLLLPIVIHSLVVIDIALHIATNPPPINASESTTTPTSTSSTPKTMTTIIMTTTPMIFQITTTITIITIIVIDTIPP